MEARNGDYIRFFARYGGHSSIQPGFSLGADPGQKAAASVEYDGIVFFIDEKDR
ncbi:hypothetical protein [Alteribacillus bidgolensis]|uniref:hypothetical protein n=1 Tax=Alteribacillus bidgolensis TaxID=930129 RepID=UPI001FE424B7|nr:hypothetical protein [Alteribacillus bidgolensis]